MIVGSSWLIIDGSRSRLLVASCCAYWGSYQEEGPCLWLLVFVTCNRWQAIHDMWHLIKKNIDNFYCFFVFFWCYYPHTLRDSVSPVCCIFLLFCGLKITLFSSNFIYVKVNLICIISSLKLSFVWSILVKQNIIFVNRGIGSEAISEFLRQGGRGICQFQILADKRGREGLGLSIFGWHYMWTALSTFFL